jgi:hypothetical protein
VAQRPKAGRPKNGDRYLSDQQLAPVRPTS